MDLFPQPNFLLLGTSPPLQEEFLKILSKKYRAKPKSSAQNQLSVQLGEHFCQIQTGFEDPDHKCSLLLVLTSDGQYVPSDSSRPCLIVSISPTPIPTTANSLVHKVWYPYLNDLTARSILTYSIILNETFPFRLHCREPLSPLTISLLRRVFRSLDCNFDGKISIQELSSLNKIAFSTPLTTNDFANIFQILHEGAEPLWIEKFAEASIDFEDFLRLMQKLVELGYGHVVLDFIRASAMYIYFSPGMAAKGIILSGKPGGLTQIGLQFLAEIFNEFDCECPTYEQLTELFKWSGGIPPRMKNLRHMTEDEWRTEWREWSCLEPCEVARQLLALGFPRPLIAGAFEQKKEETHYSPLLIALGSIAITSISGVILFLKLKNK